MEYANVCAGILADCYSSDLRDAVPTPKDDREAVRRWFANHTGGGASLVTRMVAMYSVLCEADPSAEPEFISKKAPVENKPTNKNSPSPESTSPVSPKAKTATLPTTNSMPKVPDININLQIHISSDATPDQIDKIGEIFENMSKHIYKS
jgi:hypothetical protein